MAVLLERLWYADSAFKWLLWPVHLLMAALVACRKLGYRLGLLGSAHAGVFTVVVGNLTVGGTGKTPVSIWLARRLSERGERVGIVCSGYGGSGRDQPRLVTADSDPAVAGDEAVLAARSVDVPVASGKDRVAAARLLVEQENVAIVIADDGLQHLKMCRDFEIVVVDGNRVLGNGLCIPVGPLREPAGRLRSSDAIIVNGRGYQHPAAVTCRMVPVELRSLVREEVLPLAALRGRAVHAVAAIGNPDRFFRTLEASGLTVTRHAHRDHARLAESDFSFVDKQPVLITAKDAVKLQQPPASDVWEVRSVLTFDEPDAADQLVESILTRATKRN